jgi:hypothetical protein
MPANWLTTTARGRSTCSAKNADKSRKDGPKVVEAAGVELDRVSDQADFADFLGK